MSTATETGTFTVEQFIENAAAYNKSVKLRRAFDAVMACGYDSIEDTVAHIETVKDALLGQSENGDGFTPEKSLGFGSENGASIADTLLCKRGTVGAIRTAFAKVGSNRS
jgi:hypothetical protein